MISRPHPIKAKPLSLRATVRYYCILLKRLVFGPRLSLSANDHVLPCLVAYNRYGGYCVPLAARNRPAAQRVILGDVHEDATLEYIREQSSGGDIIHGGTFFGDFLPALSSQCGNSAMVWAFEPNPESYRCAQITLLLNNLKNVRLFNAALGARAEKGQIMVSDNEGYALGGASKLVDHNSCPERIVAVDIKVIDNLFPSNRRLSVLHLDVEGHEEAALLGAIETITRCRPTLVLEMLPAPIFMHQHLESLGYRIIKSIDGNWVLSAT